MYRIGNRVSIERNGLYMARNHRIASVEFARELPCQVLPLAVFRLSFMRQSINSSVRILP